ncbi:hypothetical protein GCM10009751_27700 [Myceligenerans crystallogenes]|uniref:Large ribosomal subunit protein bL12 C-terminal domain-containing protein n=1 Tax=Myceligenerans crystallogenes TaxID=316335 RepID=A0ABN2NG76_9MICO
MFLTGTLVYVAAIEAQGTLAGWFDGVLLAIAVMLLVLAVRHPVHDVAEPKDSAVRILDTGGSSRDRVRAILRLEPAAAARPPALARPSVAGRDAADGWIVARGLTRVRSEQAVAHLAVRGIRAVRVTDGHELAHRALLHVTPVISAPLVLSVADRIELLPVIGPIGCVAAWAAVVFVAYLVTDVLMARRGSSEPGFSVQGPFTVRLVGVDAEHELDAHELISALRSVAALGVDEARTVFRRIPTTVADRVTAAEAHRYRTALERAGATIEVVAQ